MPTEIISPSSAFAVEHQADHQEHHEIDVTPAEFCKAFEAVTNLQRFSVAGLLKLKPHHLSSETMQAHGSEILLQKIDAIVGSQAFQTHIEECIESSDSYPALLNNAEYREYIIGLSRVGFIGGLIDGLKEGEKISKPHLRLYKERLIDMNHAFTGLFDSQMARDAGFGRQHLKAMIISAYGVDHDGKASSLANSLEAGLSVEIGTKRYLEEAGRELGVTVSFGTPAQDSKKVDIVCTNGDKVLGIDIKSSDKNSGRHGEHRAHYSTIEEYGLGEYRVRELYPAAHTAIGPNFEVAASAYRQTMDRLLNQFAGL